MKYERGTCAYCGRNVPVYIPKDCDGRPVIRHHNPPPRHFYHVNWCSGTKQIPLEIETEDDKRQREQRVQKIKQEKEYRISRSKHYSILCAFGHAHTGAQELGLLDIAAVAKDLYEKTYEEIRRMGYGK